MNKLITLLFLVLTTIEYSTAQSITLPPQSYRVSSQQRLVLVNYPWTTLNQNTSLKTTIQADVLYQLNTPVTQFQRGQRYEVTHTITGHSYDLYFTSLPIMTINTTHTIVDDPQVQANMTMIDSTQQFVQFWAGIEYRGAHSQSFPKKSMRFEIWEDSTGNDTDNRSFLGMRSDDDWNLQALYNEPLRMRSMISNRIWQQWHNIHYAALEPNAVNGVTMKHVEVFVNDIYRGVYALSERVDRKQLQLEKDAYGNEGLLYKGFDWGNTAFDNAPPFDNNLNTWGGFEQKYPNNIHWNPLYDLVNFVVNSSNNDFYNQYHGNIQVNNVVDYFLFINTLRALDNLGKNTFLARYNGSGKFFYIPWDLDGVLGRDLEGHQNNAHEQILTNQLFRRLLGDCSAGGFTEQMKTRWNGLRRTWLNTAYVLQKFNHVYSYLNREGVYEREHIAFPSYQLDSNEVHYIEDWLDRRFNYLDSVLNEPCVPISVELVATPRVHIYPNPTSSVLHLTYENIQQGQAYLYTITGQLVASFDLENGSNYHTIQQYPQGIYLLNIQTKHWQQTTRVVIE